MRTLLIIFAAALLSAACGTAASDTPAGEQKRYDLRGKIISVDRAAKKAVVEHEEIPGFMEKMTMTFPIKEDWVWNELQPGADIRAELVVDSTADEPYWLEKIGIVAAPNPNAPPPPTTVPDQVGKEVPAAPLTDQDGNKFNLTDFGGKAVAVTFIYRECPLPDACIKMSRQFSDLAIQLRDDPELAKNVRLVSISFDPERDTPAKLREYGIGYLGNPEKPDFTVWKLAVGSDAAVRNIAEFFGLKYSVNEQNKAEINHNLVTAVIGPDGKVRKMLPGNRWETEELLRELSFALKNEAPQPAS